ncbi:SpoIVB peptidase [Chengkuizengella axinellae]|uniref:SpoIVB peptidase n=1 Tax=Chengkuizengella axinellae TaxID=3064388 RepID=A0ABT9IXU2_9BACL|nr:SpoIVB peptidase [Chengkuizengella sp. 2205SS18-9]MDP5273615.1 SpoIVB peptidase [Chengkuizengella sp. 2205SS18-9]
MFVKRLIGLLLVFFICIIGLSAPFQSYASFPTELRLFSGQGKQLDFIMPVHAQLTVKDPNVITVNGQSKPSFQLDLNQPISIQSNEIGHTELQLKLFGKIPFKKVRVNIMPDLKVIPGGQTIGVKLKSDGVLVVGHHLVAASDDNKISPGEKAKVKLGDLITKINKQKITEVSKVSDVVNEAGEKGKAINLTLLRDGKEVKVKLKPVFDVEDNKYRLGLYIRDSAAGVGTLTFYSSDLKKYGALGHTITDMDTNTPIVVGKGEIVHSKVTSISKSKNGTPGEKRAILSNQGKVLGNITKNTPFGIFGNMDKLPDHGIMNKALPVAFSEEIKQGPAQILTVVDGQKVEAFDIEIKHIAEQNAPATKGMIIKITDQRLIEKTGGIVQGMSGSPIIQDGKIIGAVTHVFVNDPTSGYGCFIEWMLKDADIMENVNNSEETAA